MLIARRLIEAGARCVTLAFSRWDHHGDNFGALRQDLPLFDQGVSALVEDLHQRGLDQDVSLVVWASLVAPQPSTKMRDAIIGRACRALCWPAAG